MKTITSYTPTLDKFAVSTSAFCALHCLFLPFLLGVFPALGASIFGQDSFHTLLLWLVIPLSVLALLMGCQKHKRGLVALTGLAGVSVIIVAASMGHEGLGEMGERLTTLIGAILIATGHICNYVFCRRVECDE